VFIHLQPLLERKNSKRFKHLQNISEEVKYRTFLLFCNGFHTENDMLDLAFQHTNTCTCSPLPCSAKSKLPKLFLHASRDLTSGGTVVRAKQLVAVYQEGLLPVAVQLLLDVLEQLRPLCPWAGAHWRNLPRLMKSF
jgi:hypothetical protein